MDKDDRQRKAVINQRNNIIPLSATDDFSTNKAVFKTIVY